MFFDVLGLFMLIFAFYGTKRDAHITRIMFLGATLYERRRDPALPPPAVTFDLLSRGSDAATPAAEEAEDEDEEDDEEEEADERTLLERLEDLEIPTIDARGVTEIGDIGSVFFDTDADEDDCPSCENDTLHAFGEVIGAETYDREDKPGRALRNRYGSACDACGHLDIDTTFERRGRFGPLIGDRVELDLFEILKGFEPAEEPETADEDDASLAERERELEGELNELRIRRRQRALANGAIDPFRGTPGEQAAPPPPKPSDDDATS